MNARTTTIPAQRNTAGRLAVALMSCTILAGTPTMALAQQAAAPAAPTPATPETAAPAPAVSQGEVIRTIGVAGAQRLEPETIVSYIRLRSGDIYTAATADQALKDLAATELFADFSIANNDGNVVITVVENPVINRIVLEGNKRLKDDKIEPEIKLAARQIFTRSKVRADVARIIELYKRQGRFAATVEPQMVMLDQNRVDVVFEITEGPKSKVRQINILGNDAFSDGDLRGEMVTKVAGITKIFSGGTTYDPDRLAFDQQKLRQFYLTQGYADFRVVSAVAELTPDKRDFIITYVVEEGERYKFGKVGVESRLRDFDSERMTATLPMQVGDWYDAKLVEDTVEQMTELAGTFGYAFADVRPEFTRSRDNLTMDVTFVINEAPRVYIERIDVNGNTLTQDKVVRREFRVAEGDAFNSIQVKRSTARINSLGYFQENFEISQVDGSAPDRIVLEANVQEKPTGELTLSAGFSSLESFIFQGSIKQRNFRGRGQTVGLGLNYSRYSRSANISFTEPYVFDKNISMGIDIYRRDYNNGYFDRSTATYEQATTGMQLRVGVPLSEYMTVLGRYTFNRDNVTIAESTYFADLDGDGVRTCEPLLAGRYLCDAIGNRTSSILGLSLIYQDLDNGVRPTRGQRATASFDFAGLGGSTRYARATVQGTKYWQLAPGWVVAASLEGGYIQGLGDAEPGSDKVLMTDRFFLGEPEIRGFDIRGIGPRVVRQFYDIVDGEGVLRPINDPTTADDALGGRAYYLGKLEMDIPLSSGARELGLRPSIFLDMGSVFALTAPEEIDNPYPGDLFIPTRDASGNQLYTQVTAVSLVEGACVVTAATTVTNAINPSPPSCLDTTYVNNSALGNKLPPFMETYYPGSWKPRMAIGIGVNWNSPFGPFRINLAYPLLKQKGDDSKTFSFNVGTQF